MKKKIINGVDVSSCEELCSDAVHPSCYHLNGFCEDNPNCMFKQHAHKTAECEKLSSQIETYSKMLEDPKFMVALTDVRTGEREVWRKLGNKAQRYEQALNDIENIINKNSKSFNFNNLIETIQLMNNFIGDFNRIKNIISKVRDNNNETSEASS